MPDNVSAENQPDPKKDAAVQSSAPPEVALRAPVPADVPLLFAFESDPAWCAMAMLKPRSRQAFEAVWAGMFRDWAAEEARASGETRASRESLTSAEFALLEILAETVDAPVSRAHILDRLGAESDRYIDRNVDVLVLRLRRKIERNPDLPRHIRTRRGKGYVLSTDSGEPAP